MNGAYTYETDHYIIQPFVTGSKRYHQVKRKEGKSFTQTFTDYEEARKYVDDMEQAFKLNYPDD
jgi:hypothetical protein